MPFEGFDQFKELVNSTPTSDGSGGPSTGAATETGDHNYDNAWVRSNILPWLPSNLTGLSGAGLLVPDVVARHNTRQDRLHNDAARDALEAVNEAKRLDAEAQLDAVADHDSQVRAARVADDLAFGRALDDAAAEFGRRTNAPWLAFERGFRNLDGMTPEQVYDSLYDFEHPERYVDDVNRPMRWADMARRGSMVDGRFVPDALLSEDLAAIRQELVDRGFNSTGKPAQPLIDFDNAVEEARQVAEMYHRYGVNRSRTPREYDLGWDPGRLRELASVGTGRFASDLPLALDAFRLPRDSTGYRRENFSRAERAVPAVREPARARVRGFSADDESKVRAEEPVSDAVRDLQNGHRRAKMRSVARRGAGLSLLADWAWSHLSDALTSSAPKYGRETK